MNVVCPHCHESITLSTRENQTVTGCHHCNGTFKIEILNPSSNKSSIVPKPDDIKILCPHCYRKVLMPKSMLNTAIQCPDCKQEYVTTANNVIFSIPDTRVAAGAQLKEPVRLKPPAMPTAIVQKPDAVVIRPS